MEMIQAMMVLLVMFVGLLAMLFVALVAAAAATDRARVPVAERPARSFRHQ